MGFFGQHLCGKLRKAYPQSNIKVIDLKQNPYPIYNYKELKINVKLNQDITKSETMEDEFKDIDVVFHLAGMVSFSIRHKKMLEDVNVLRNLNLTGKACPLNTICVLNIMPPKKFSSALKKWNVL